MQAILILAHKNIQQVIDLSNLLASNFKVFVHIDKNYHLSQKEIKQLQNNNIQYLSEINVNWGGWSIAEATIKLMRLALRDPEISYFHVISGQDWPLIDPDDIYSFYENTNNIYMEYHNSEKIKKAGEPVIWWQKYYFNYDTIKRRSYFGKFYHRALLVIQTLFHVNKFKNLNIKLKIYNGPNWVDIPRDALLYALNCLESDNNLLKMFQTGCFSDEFWLQTILVNNPIYKSRIVCNNHRFVKWSKKNGSYPAILDISDMPDISMNYHFIRKIDYSYSKELISTLKKYR